MLNHLGVHNIGVVADASLELTPGLNVITGETGAGKTLLLGGLRLLLGDRADSGAVGRMGSEARVEGLFTERETEIGVTRVVPGEGRSRAYVDGALVPANVLAERIGPMVEVVGQHDQLSLRRPGFVLRLIDGVGGETHDPALGAYRDAWMTLKQVEADLAELGGDQMSLRRELDLVAFQADEISRESPDPAEEESLEGEASRLRNAAEIISHLAETSRLVEEMRERGGEAIARLRKVADLDPGSREVSGQAELMGEAIGDLAREVSALVESLEPDPDRLEYVESRLTVLGDLKRKYGRTLHEVTRFGVDAAARRDEIQRALGRADAIEAELREAQAILVDAAAALGERREAAAAELARATLVHLADLGMDRPEVEVRLLPAEPGPTGANRAEIWFASDTRLDLAPVGTGASGGELSRLVLAIRLAAREDRETTLVFDEVDTGIGGATALAMGRKLADLAVECQVICVTHLPQVAAFADTHHVVTRDGPHATASLVTGEARLREITRMLAGLPESVVGNQAAAELLAVGSSRG